MYRRAGGTAPPGPAEGGLARAVELLHGGGEGCERACYDCLCRYENQQHHVWLDADTVLPLLRRLAGLDVVPLGAAGGAEDRFADMERACESGLEREVLVEIRTLGLPVPEEAQHTIFDGQAPLARADFYYSERRVGLFVDGGPHDRDFVQIHDERVRRRLRALGYTVVEVPAAARSEALGRLADALGARRGQD